MTPRLERAIESAEAMSAGIGRAAQPRGQKPDFLSHTGSVDRTASHKSHTSLRTRLIGTLPMFGLSSAVLGGVGIAAMNSEGANTSETATIQSAAAMGIESQSIFEQPAVTMTTDTETAAPTTVLQVELAAATRPLAAPVLAKNEPQKPGDVITATEITAAISAGVLVETTLETESSQDKKGKVITPKKGEKPKTTQEHTIWDAYAKDLGNKLNKKATPAQLNVDTRLSDRITTAHYAHNQDPKKQSFNDTAMNMDTKYLALTDNAQLVAAALLKIDVKALEANKNIPASVIETVKALQKMNAQPAETKKTRSSIEQQNLLAADKSLAIFTKLKVAYTKPEFKAFIDKLLADYTATHAKGKNKLSDEAFQKAAQTFFARTAVKTALA